MGIGFDFKAGFNNFCDNFNFKPCRFADIVENHGCNGLQVRISDESDFILYDIPFLILALVVGAVLMIFVHLFTDKSVKYKKQIETRGKWYYRVHLILYGMSLVIWAIALCLTSTMGSGQNAVFALYYCVLNMSMGVLFYIALIDIHAVPCHNWLSAVPCVIVCLVFGIPIFTVVNSDSPGVVALLFGFVIPLAVPIFHFLAMLPVLIARKLWQGLGYLVGSFLSIELVQILNVFAQGPICDGTGGYLTGASICAIICAFYRIFLQLYYKALKDVEVKDGLLPGAKKVGDMSSSELNKPFPIDQDDYSYTYTYTDTDDIL